MLIERPSPNHDERPHDQAIDMLVLHYTGMTSAEAALERLCDPDAKVSAHYLIDEDGTLYRLVEEGRRAWHAGVSFWRGETNINARSIGIELVNPGHEFGYRRFPPPQMAALVRLAQDVLARRPIPPRNVVGHSDVAPQRKQDPGELFDWPGLAARGVGLWPTTGKKDTAVPDPGEVSTLLASCGYETSDLVATVTAFQRRFRPAKVDGEIDRETARRVAAVCEAFNG